MTQNIQQLREEFKQKIDILNNYLFAQGLSDPMTRIQQLSFFFFRLLTRRLPGGC